MKITLQQNDRTTTIEEDDEDQDIEAMLLIFSDLLQGQGYVFSGHLELIEDEPIED